MKICNTSDNTNEILVPVIFYMDGITTDNAGRLNLTPLNMTLGIFNIQTRMKAEAWTTIYYHPDSDTENQYHSCKPTPIESLQNLHEGLRVALQSFHNVTQQGGLYWNTFPYGGKTWKVKLKFAIAYVIGDTELHDKLCGKYGVRNASVKKLCRHCDCSRENTDNVKAQKKTKLYLPRDFDSAIEKERPGYFKSLSHHPIDNVFHSLEFGANPHNIHFATPGECLHMHQLGAEKRSIEAFQNLLCGKVNDEYGDVASSSTNIQSTLSKISYLAYRYGGCLVRQSERNLPRTKFRTLILNTANREGHEYAGIILNLLLAIISDRGREILLEERKMKPERIDDQIYIFELLLGMEEWLKSGQHTYREITKVGEAMNGLMKIVKLTCQREGMGTKLIKFHLLFHMQKYMEMYGPPKGWDSAPSETHHKTEVKAPAKNTQRRPTKLIEQTCKRYEEMLVLRQANAIYNIPTKTIKHENDVVNIKKGMTGARFIIGIDDENKNYMKWQDSRNNNKQHHFYEIIDFVCENILKQLKGTKQINGYTQYKKIININQKEIVLFRSHPSYRSDSKQKTSIWYDWAEVRYENEIIPAQLLCFFTFVNNAEDECIILNNVQLENNDDYVIVRLFTKPKQGYKINPDDKKSYCELMNWGELRKGLFLLNCDNIISQIAVVPNIASNDNKNNRRNNRGYFVVTKKQEWKNYFSDFIHSFEIKRK